jgi:outer membrane protein
MKNGLIVLNVILLIAVVILFFLYFDSKKTTGTLTSKAGTKDSAGTSTANFKIAYFEMDSIENNLAMVKDAQAELSKKEDAINNELAKIDRSIREKANEYQGKAATMTQGQLEMAKNDMAERQRNFDAQKQQYDQDYKEVFTRKMQEVRTKIENYLKEYNKAKGYSFIISYEPGLVYYKDSIYNITGDVVKGLNEMYKKKKD